MLRILLATTLLTGPAWADDFLTSAPVTDVTVYPRGASVTRSFTADLPAGAHRVLIPYDANQLGNPPPRIKVPEGVVLGAVQVLPKYLTDAQAVLTAAQQTAQDNVDAAQTTLQARTDVVTRARAMVTGQEQKLAYLRSVTGASLTAADPDALRDVGDMVAEEIARGVITKLEADVTLRDAIEAQEDAQKALDQAERDLERLSPPQGDVDILAISVTVANAGVARMTLDTLIRNAQWQADYDINLTRGTPAKIDMSRKVVLGQWTDEAWTDARLTLSTANPFAQVLPTEPYPSLAQIRSTQEKNYIRSAEPEAMADSRTLGTMAEPIVETAQAVIDGLSVTYVYPQPVSVESGGNVILSLDKFTFDAREFNRAAPRFDQTAFLMAEFTNTTPEPFLPGEASVSRDGVFVGRIPFENVPAGAKTELSFGTLEGLRLDYTLLDNNTGDRGFLTTSSTRDQEMEFSVENLMDTRETVQTIFALPYSEQEDLTVKVRAAPAPDEEDFDQRRDVSVWSLELAPGEKKTVRVTVNFDWPDGEELFWQP